MNEVLRDELIELINTRSYYENERSMFKMVTDITNAVYLSLPTAGPAIVSNIKPMEKQKDIKDLRIKPEELILHFEVIDDKGENFFTKQQVNYYVVLESNKDILLQYIRETFTNSAISSTPISTAEEFHETFLEFIMDQPKLAADLYDKFVGFLNDFEDIGKSIDKSKESYDKAINKLSSGRGNLISRSQKFLELGVKPTKEISNKYIKDEE